MTLDELINTAMYSPSDQEAAEAMMRLREIDPTYHYCEEYDGLVMTLQECTSKEIKPDNLKIVFI